LIKILAKLVPSGIYIFFLVAKKAVFDGFFVGSIEPTTKYLHEPEASAVLPGASTRSCTHTAKQCHSSNLVVLAKPRNNGC
jgi:hypothetical protein